MLVGTTASVGSEYEASNTLTVSGYSIEVGDILLLQTCVYLDGAESSVTWTDPSGMTPGPSLSSPIADQSMNSENAWSHLAAMVATESQAGAPSFTTSISAAGATGIWAQHLRVYRGRANSSISAALANFAQTAVATGNDPFDFSITGLTALAGDDIVVLVPLTSQGDEGDTSAISISGYANALGITSAAGYSGYVCSIDQVDAPAGATGTLASVISGFDVGESSLYAGATVISLPSASGGVGLLGRSWAVNPGIRGP